MSGMVTGDFNYGDVDPETAAKLEYFAKAGKAILRKSQIEFIAKIGEVLSDARKMLASHDKNEGVFIKWAMAEFDIGKQTIYNYVNAWDRILSKGWTTYVNWTQTALYLASSDDFPNPVKKKLEKIPATDFVRTSDIKRLIDASKPKPEPSVGPQRATPSSVAQIEAQQRQTIQELDDDADPFDVPDDPEPEPVPEPKPERTPAELAKLNRQLAQSLIDKAVRAVDDLNHVNPNPSRCATVVKLLQQAGGSLW